MIDKKRLTGLSDSSSRVTIQYSEEAGENRNTRKIQSGEGRRTILFVDGVLCGKSTRISITAVRRPKNPDPESRPDICGVSIGPCPYHPGSETSVSGRSHDISGPFKVGEWHTMEEVEDTFARAYLDGLSFIHAFQDGSAEDVRTLEKLEKLRGVSEITTLAEISGRTTMPVSDRTTSGEDHTQPICGVFRSELS